MAGAHGLRPINFEEDIDNNVYNRLVSNNDANEWQKHIEFNFDTDIEENDTPHGLKPIDGYLDGVHEPDLSTPEKIEEFNKFNKLLSNKIYYNIINQLKTKPSSKIFKILSSEWEPNSKDKLYSFKVKHDLNTKVVCCTMYQEVERIGEDGFPIKTKAVVVPRNIFIIDENNIEIESVSPENTEVLILANTEFVLEE